MATIDDLEGLLEDLDGKIDTLTAKVDQVRADVNVPRTLQRFCRHCGGTGNKVSGTPPHELGTCPNCGGDGLKRIARITLTSEE